MGERKVRFCVVVLEATTYCLSGVKQIFLMGIMACLWLFVSNVGAVLVMLSSTLLSIVGLFANGHRCGDEDALTVLVCPVVISDGFVDV